VPFYVGDRDDALRNCIRAAQGQGFRSVMILRSDSPLIDPVIMAQVKAKYLESGDGNQYVSNRLKRTYPEGMEVEMVGVELLSQAYLAANQWSDFKDPTRLLRRGDLSHCRTVDVVQAVDQSQWRFCLDTWADHQQLSTLLGLVQNYSLQELMTAAQAHGLLVQKSRSDEDPGGGPGLVKKRPPSIGR
jgi:spore coat polysaccharide biosynthesis protein SpsF